MTKTKQHIVSYGGGTNSTALLIGLWEKGLKPDLILFADTGGEKKCTYEYVNLFSKWLVENSMPPITIVQKIDKNGKTQTLEQDCLSKKMLPSLAYGFKSCSQKFKIQPQDKYCNHVDIFKKVWAEGKKVTKLIGFDAGESHRAENHVEDKKYIYKYPLIEWGWARELCREVIKNSGLPLPGKSSCFFCPASKKKEILKLKDEYKKRAIQMEENADLRSIKGLGRYFSWKNFIEADERQMKLFPEVTIEMSCGCYDG